MSDEMSKTERHNRIAGAKILLNGTGSIVVPEIQGSTVPVCGEPEIEKECEHEWRRHTIPIGSTPETWHQCKKCGARQDPVYSPQSARAYIKSKIPQWMRDVGYQTYEHENGTATFSKDGPITLPSIWISDIDITVSVSFDNGYVGQDTASAWEVFEKVVEPLKPQLLKKLFEQKLGGEWEIDTCVIRNKGDRFCWYNHVCMDYTLGIGCRVIENQPPSDFVTAFKKAHPTITYTFKECPECAKKTGHPVLCPSCLHNRSVIEDLLQKIKGDE